MKKLFALSIASFVLTITALAGVNEKLLYSFNQAFPLAQNIKWSEDDKGYFVTFTQFGILSKVIYDTEGDFVYALRYYKEENLPVSILLTVRKKFPDKKIAGVTELSCEDNVTYHLRLEDAKSWYGIAVTSTGSVTIE